MEVSVTHTWEVCMIFDSLFVGLLVGWLVGWFVGWLVGWLVLFLVVAIADADAAGGSGGGGCLRGCVGVGVEQAESQHADGDTNCLCHKANSFLNLYTTFLCLKFPPPARPGTMVAFFGG